MQKLDTNDFCLGKGENHTVNYYLYSGRMKNLDKFDVPKSLSKAKADVARNAYDRDKKYYKKPVRKYGVCFASLLREVSDAKGEVNRLVYVLNKSRQPQLLENEKIRWLNMCVKAKALPDYIKSSDIRGGRYVIRLDDQLPPSLLYIYLTCIRWIQECPEFIKNMLILVDKYNMSFYLAWLVSSCFSINNTWHNIVPYGYCYRGGLESIINNDKINLTTARGFKNFLSNPTKHDKRSCMKSADRSFLAEQNIQKASDIGKDLSKTDKAFLINVSQTSDLKLTKAIESESITSLLKLFRLDKITKK